MKRKDHADELALLGKMKMGDQDAFKYFFDAYYTDLCNYVNLYSRDESLSEEIVQEVFIYFWNCREEITIGRSVSAYLFTASKHKALNHVRSEKFKIRALSDYNADVRAHGARPVEILESVEYEEILEKVIDQLPPRCREIFLLRRREGYSTKKIASELHLSPKTVENQMTIALRKVQEYLSSQVLEGLSS